MYFDLQYYWRVLRHVWLLKQWPGRTRMLVRLLLLVPLEYVFNAVFFMLDYLVFPALWRQRVERPVFIVGHARSGTTLAHRLLAADGNTFSYFLYWEMFFPSLLQKRIIQVFGYIDEKWLGRAINKRLVAWDDKTFGPYRHMHDMSLWNSEEDQFVMRAAFVTQQWSLDIPMMDVIDIFHVDEMPRRKRRRWLHHYRECVKRQLLLNGGDKIHLSKNPVMCGWVGALIETFPDAHIVVMMRDPVQCIPSVLKLVEMSWQGKGWTRADYERSLQILTDLSFESFQHPAQVLSRHAGTPQAVVDYRELTAQPRATVHKIYRQLGMPLTDSFDRYLQAQEETEKSHQTHFRYDLSDYAVSREQIEMRLSAFYDTYHWPRIADAGADTKPMDNIIGS
ncbi:MAG: sulfotransferase [Halioglobus sp.]|nr:sulfotransferase [Halioglobus sp.]